MTYKIPFNIPVILNKEYKYIQKVIKNNFKKSNHIEKCNQWLEKNLNTKRALLTPSCTHALELAAILIDVKHGDEVIMPSYTFVSTANAFVLRGAKIKFIDINPVTMNLDVESILSAITKKTKAIVPVHYAGVSCDMKMLISIAKSKNIFVIEDAAQSLMSSYKGKPLGSYGHLSCISFHQTKNIHCGEGGAILINDPRFIERAEIIREKGTNRSAFNRGLVDKYKWVDIGSSYLPSEISAAFLYAQLDNSSKIIKKRIILWNEYYRLLSPLKKIEIMTIPKNVKHNAHMFYIKLKDMEERTRLMKYLFDKKIESVFHYIPLHSSDSCSKYFKFVGKDIYTTKESSRLLRLPLYYSLKKTDIHFICKMINNFFYV